MAQVENQAWFLSAISLLPDEMMTPDLSESPDDNPQEAASKQREILRRQTLRLTRLRAIASVVTSPAFELLQDRLMAWVDRIDRELIWDALDEYKHEDILRLRSERKGIVKFFQACSNVVTLIPQVEKEIEDAGVGPTGPDPSMQPEPPETYTQPSNES